MFRRISSLLLAHKTLIFQFFVVGSLLCLPIVMLIGYFLYQKLQLKEAHNQELRMCFSILHKRFRAIEMEMKDIKINTNTLKRPNVYNVHGDLFSGRSTKVEHRYADGCAYLN